jgi:prepilin-type N-terminal cleavage/methylation domain-containing protein
VLVAKLMTTARRHDRGLTLIELMVVVALVVIVISVAAPSFRRMIDTQRVVGMNSQVVTDMQLARSEAATRGVKVRIAFKNSAAMTCYSIFTYTSNALQCDCLQADPCSGLPAGYTEIKTRRLPKDVTLRVFPNIATNKNNAAEFAFEPLAGGLYTIPLDFAWDPLDKFTIRTFVGADLELNTVIGQSGRPIVCAPGTSKIKESAC